MAGFGILLWVSANVVSVISLMLVSQNTVHSAAAGIQEGPHDNRLIESPVDSTAAPQDQRHVLERFVDTHPSALFALHVCLPFSLCLVNTVKEQVYPNRLAFVLCQTEATGTGGGGRRAGQEQRVAAETPAEEKPRWPEESPTHPRSVGEQRRKWKRAAERLQLYPGRGPRQEPNAAQGARQGGSSVSRCR